MLRLQLQGRHRSHRPSYSTCPSGPTHPLSSLLHPASRARCNCCGGLAPPSHRPARIPILGRARAQLRGTGMRPRLLALNRPLEGARCVSPDLEESYTHQLLVSSPPTPALPGTSDNCCPALHRSFAVRKCSLRVGGGGKEGQWLPPPWLLYLKQPRSLSHRIYH